MFGKSMFHLGMLFQNLGLSTLFINDHISLKSQKSLEMLNLFGLKITFILKNNFKFCNVYLFFDLIFYVTIQNFVTRNPTLSTWVVRTTYKQLDYRSTKSIKKAHIWINIID
jgi:hypothetical protein